MHKIFLRIALLIGVILALATIHYFDLTHYLSLPELKSRHLVIQSFYHEHPVKAVSAFTLIFILLTTLSVPCVTLLNLAAGAIFGFWLGVLISSISSTLGATFSFVLSRFLFRDFATKKFSKSLMKINEGLAENGALYLFYLRLIPVFPYFMINIVFGLTQVPIRTFMWVSQLGMLGLTMVYVNAGTQLAKVQTFGQVFTPAVIFFFFFIAVFPLFGKKFF